MKKISLLTLILSSLIVVWLSNIFSPVFCYPVKVIPGWETFREIKDEDKDGYWDKQQYKVRVDGDFFIATLLRNKENPSLRAWSIQEIGKDLTLKKIDRHKAGLAATASYIKEVCPGLGENLDVLSHSYDRASKNMKLYDKLESIIGIMLQIEGSILSLIATGGATTLSEAGVKASKEIGEKYLKEYVESLIDSLDKNRDIENSDDLSERIKEAAFKVSYENVKEAGERIKEAAESFEEYSIEESRYREAKSFYDDLRKGFIQGSSYMEFWSKLHKDFSWSRFVAETVDNLTGGVAGISVGEILEFVDLETIFSEDKLIQEALASLEEKIQKEEAFFSNYESMYNIFDLSSAALALLGDETEVARRTPKPEPQDTKLVRIEDDTGRVISQETRKNVHQLINHVNEKWEQGPGLFIKVVEDAIGRKGQETLAQDFLMRHRWKYMDNGRVLPYSFLILAVRSRNSILCFFHERQSFLLHNELNSILRSSQMRDFKQKGELDAAIDFLVREYVEAFDKYVKRKAGSLEGSLEQMARTLGKVVKDLYGTSDSIPVSTYELALDYTHGELARGVQLMKKWRETLDRLEAMSDKEKKMLFKVYDVIYGILLGPVECLGDLSGENWKIIERKELPNNDLLILLGRSRGDGEQPIRSVYLCRKGTNNWTFDYYLMSQGRRHLESFLRDLKEDVDSFPYSKYQWSPGNTVFLIVDILSAFIGGAITWSESERLLSPLVPPSWLREMGEEFRKDFGEVVVLPDWIRSDFVPDYASYTRSIEAKVRKDNLVAFVWGDGGSGMVWVLELDEGIWRVRRADVFIREEDTPRWVREHMKPYPENLDEIIEDFSLKPRQEFKQEEIVEEKREEKPLDFLTYENSKYGFRIRYPRDWIKGEEKEEEGLFSSIFSPSEEDLDKANIVFVMVVGMEEWTSLDNATEMMLYEASRTTDFKLLESKADSLGGYPAHRIVYTGKEGQYDFKFMRTWIIHNSKLYCVMFGFEVSEYSKWIETVEKMVESFDILTLSEILMRE